MNLQESGEMYLETILLLSKKNKPVHSVDVSAYMGYSKPSVSRAMALLRDGGYIIMEKNGEIILTESGKTTAEMIYERHKVLTEFLVSIGVSEAVAAADACKIEHVISNETLEKLKSGIAKLKEK